MIPLYTQEEFNKAKSRDKLSLQCKRCDKKFYKRKNEIQAILHGNCVSTYDFCSTKCKSDNQYSRVSVCCEQCEKSFMKHKSKLKKQNIIFVQSLVRLNILMLIKQKVQESLN